MTVLVIIERIYKCIRYIRYIFPVIKSFTSNETITGTKVTVPDKKVPYFKPGKEIKEMLIKK